MSSHHQEQKRVTITDDEEIQPSPPRNSNNNVVVLTPEETEKKVTLVVVTEEQNDEKPENESHDEDDDDEFAHIITEGLLPEIAHVALELAKQVESLGKHLTEEDVEETSHRNDPLYREFLKAGAHPNPQTGEMQISIVQFHKHLRHGSRGLTATEKLQGIVDEDFDFYHHQSPKSSSTTTLSASRKQKTNQKSNVHVGRDTSDYFLQSSLVGDGLPNGNNNNRSSQVAQRPLADYEKVMMTMSECYLTFNQVSALIRHHTSGPQQRKSRTSFLMKRKNPGAISTTSMASTTNFSTSAPESPSTTLNNTNASENNNVTNNNNEIEAERSTQFMSNSGFFNVSHTSHFATTSEVSGDVQQQQQNQSISFKNNNLNNNSFETSSSLPTPNNNDVVENNNNNNNGRNKRGSIFVSSSSSAILLNNNNNNNNVTSQQQESSPLPAASSSPSSPQPTNNNGNNNKDEISQKRPEETSFRSEDSEEDDDEDQVENEFFSTNQEKKHQHVSKYDKILAKVERISHSPQRVHGGKTSDSVVPTYLIPKRQFELQKRREVIARLREETSSASRERRRSDASQQQQQQQQNNQHLKQETSLPQFSSTAGSVPLSPMFSTSDFSSAAEHNNNNTEKNNIENNSNVQQQPALEPQVPVKPGYGFLDGNSRYKSKLETRHKLPDRPSFSPRSHRAVSPQERYEAFVAYSQKRNRVNIVDNNKVNDDEQERQQQPKQNPRSKRVLAVEEHQRKLREEEERKKRAAAAPPLSFSYYKWMQSQKRTLPISALEAGFVSEEELSSSVEDEEEAKNHPTAKPYYSASYYEHQKNPEKFTRPTSSRSRNNIHQDGVEEKDLLNANNNNDEEEEEEEERRSRPQSATAAPSKTRHLSFVSHRSNANWIKLKNKNVGFGMPPPLNREHFPQFRHLQNINQNNENEQKQKPPTRPTSAMSNHNNTKASYQPHAGQSAIVVNKDNNITHQQRQLQQELFAKLLQNQDIPSVTLIPEKHNFVFAKLSSRGPSYLVRPEYAQEQEEKKKMALRNKKENKKRDVSFSSTLPSTKKEADHHEDSFVDVDDDDEEDDDDNDDHVESFFKDGKKNNNNSNTKVQEEPSWENSRSNNHNKPPGSFSMTRRKSMNVTQQNQILANSIMLMEKDEQARIRDDDTTANGLAKMMRAHIATRTIQRWFRSLYYLKRELCIRYIQRVGRGFVKGRKEVAKILIPVVVDDDNNKKKMITRTQYCVERLQRVGRGFIHARKRLANQYDHETFDRNIGRFAALMGIRSCLSHYGNKNNNNNNNHMSPVVNKENRSLTFDDIPMVSVTDEYSTNNNNYQNSKNGSSPLTMSPKTSFKQPQQQQNNNKLQSFANGGSFLLNNSSPSFRQKQEQIQKTHYRSEERPPEDVRLKYALFASEEKKRQSDNYHHQKEEEEEIVEQQGEKRAAHDDEEVDFNSKRPPPPLSPAVIRKEKTQEPHSPFFTGRRNSPHRNQAEYEKLVEREQFEADERERAEKRKNLRWHPPSRVKVPKDFCDPNGTGDVDILAKFI